MRVVYLVRSAQTVAILGCVFFLFVRQANLCSWMSRTDFERNVHLAMSRDENGSCNVTLSRYLDFYVYQPHMEGNSPVDQQENETYSEKVKRLTKRSRRQLEEVGNYPWEAIFEKQGHRLLKSCVTVDWMALLTDKLFLASSLRTALFSLLGLLLLLAGEVVYLALSRMEYTMLGSVLLNCVHALLVLLSAVSLLFLRFRWDDYWQFGLAKTPAYPRCWFHVELASWLLGLLFFLEMFNSRFVNGCLVLTGCCPKADDRREKAYQVSVHDDALGRPSYELLPQ